WWGMDRASSSDPPGLLRVAEAGRIDPSDVGKMIGVAFAGAGGERIRQQVKDDRNGLDPLHSNLEGRVLQRDNHFCFRIDGSVDEVRQRRQVTLRAGELELVIATRLHVGFPKA